MSWDVVLFKSKQKIQTVAKIDEKQLIEIDFDKKIELYFLDITKKENYIEIKGANFSIDYYCSPPKSNTMLQLYGENSIYALIEFSKKYDLQIYDSALDAMIDLDNPSINGYKNHKNYVTHIMENKQNL